MSTSLTFHQPLPLASELLPFSPSGATKMVISPDSVTQAAPVVNRFGTAGVRGRLAIGTS